MSLRFTCPHCGQRISAAKEDAGTVGGCPRCQQQFVVPTSEEATPEPGFPPAPKAEPVTRHGLAIVALILAIFPVFNLVALGLAIFAVARSDRPGRSGERGLALSAIVICGLLFVPVNLAGTVAVTAPRLFKSAMVVLDFKPKPKPASPAPAPAKH